MKGDQLVTLTMLLSLSLWTIFSSLCFRFATFADICFPKRGNGWDAMCFLSFWGTSPGGGDLASTPVLWVDETQVKVAKGGAEGIWRSRWVGSSWRGVCFAFNTGFLCYLNTGTHRSQNHLKCSCTILNNQGPWFPRIQWGCYTFRVRLQ